jgi:hypothetical protein
MECLTDQEVRSAIKFSGMFGDKTYAQVTHINELRQKLEWLYKIHPDTIPEYQRSKINTHVRCKPTMNIEVGNIISLALGCTVMVCGITIVKYVITLMMEICVFIKLYGTILLYLGLFVVWLKLYFGETPAPVSNRPVAYKKQPISSTLKRKVWDTHIGQSIGLHKCLCCNLTDITQLSFHCGHIIPESKGGETNLSNLIPICQNCNSSMGSKHMGKFMDKFH